MGCWEVLKEGATGRVKCLWKVWLGGLGACDLAGGGRWEVLRGFESATGWVEACD